jgi:hypothetical protein
VHVRIAQFFEEGFQRIGLPRLDEAAMVGASEVVDVVGGPFLVTSRPSLFVRYDLDSAFQRLGSVGMGVTLTVIKWSKASFISSSTLRHLRSATISQNGVAIRLVDCASVARCRKPLSVLVGTNRMLALVTASRTTHLCHCISRMRAFDRDLIRGRHYGQRSCEPHSKAEHMAAPTQACHVRFSLPTWSRPHMGTTQTSEMSDLQSEKRSKADIAQTPFTSRDL